MTTITDDIINNFCDYYIEQGGAVFFNAFDLANAVADAFGEMSREDFTRLVNRCEDVIKTKTGHVSPFANLTDAPNAWNPV